MHIEGLIADHISLSDITVPTLGHQVPLNVAIPPFRSMGNCITVDYWKNLQISLPECAMQTHGGKTRNPSVLPVSPSHSVS